MGGGSRAGNTSRARAGGSRSRRKAAEAGHKGIRPEGSDAESDGESELDARALEAILAKKGLYIRQVEADGSCLFRAVADQLYGNQHVRHEEVRARAVRYMRDNADAFSPFVVDTPFEDYCDLMMLSSTWGGNIELQALSMAYTLNLRIHQVGAPCYDIVNDFGKKAEVTPVHLSYHDGLHYNSVRLADEDRFSEQAANHVPLHTNSPGAFTGRAMDEDEVAISAEVKEPGFVTEVRLRKKEVDEIVEKAMRILMSFVVFVKASHVGRALKGIPADGAMKVDVDKRDVGGEEAGRVVNICRKKWSELQDNASASREIASGALRRAMRIEHLQSADGEDIEDHDKTTKRAIKRIYRELEDAYSKARTFQDSVEGCAQLSDASSPPVGEAKRPSKQKAKRAKVNERKARRQREHEKGGGAVAAPAVSAIEDKIHEVAI